MARRRKVFQSNFIAGELAPDLEMRQDARQYSSGLKSALNSRLLIAGGSARRPGSWWLATEFQDGALVPFVATDGTEYLLYFTNAAMHAYLPDGTPSGAIATAAPWTAATAAEMEWVRSGNTILLTHPNFIALVVRTAVATWTFNQLPWTRRTNDRIAQPHYKVAAAAMTLKPSATTGNITLTVSSAYWQALHVGTRIRYLDREININSITSSLIANGTVLETLLPTQRLTVTSSASFAVDEVVEGDTSGAHGFINAIPDATHLDVSINRGFTKFTVENVTGPNGLTAISAVADVVPAAIVDWTEQLYSILNGFPRAVEIHRGRILFGGSAALPSGLAGSSVIDVFDFDVGTGSDAQGFVTTIGDSAALTINHLHSAEQLLIGTDYGLYYVPESPANPFRPTSLAFNHFGGEWPISAPHPGDFDGGVVFVSNSVIIRADATGSTTKLWDARDVSLFSPHLIKTPRYAAYITNFLGGPERYGFFVNEDGTLAVLMMVDSQEIRNVAPWETDGEYRSLAALGTDLYAMVRRMVGNTTVYVLERFDADLTLDAATTYTTLSDLEARYGGSGVNVLVEGPFHLGTYPLSIPTVPDGPYTVGFFYDRTLQTLPPAVDDEEGPAAGQPMRISEVVVDVLNSCRFAVNGSELTAYQATETLDDPPPLRTGPQRFRPLGWQAAPTVTISQGDPLPLNIRSIRSTVVY